METPSFDSERDLSHLERPLKGLHPLAPALSRDRMLFEAGRAAGRDQGRKRWLAATSTLASLVLGLSGLLAREHTQRQSLERALAARVSEQVPPSFVAKSAPTPVIATVSGPPEDSPYSYLAMSRRAQSGHLDDWTPLPVDPPSRGDAKRRARPLSVRDLGAALDL